jgi:ABC-type sugar transport system ATPase subunit
VANIKIENATKIYDEKTVAVDGLSLECKDKEFLAILGPSGAGKTSTLKMVAGIENLTEGSLLIGGADMTLTPTQNRNISMVCESYALYPHMTVRENLEFPLKAPIRIKQFQEGEIGKKVDEWAKIVGLYELLDRKPSQLSGGQRQRVSLARALVRSPEPSVILMDEPIAHLDAKLRNDMRAELKHLHKELGATIIYVTHDYIEAMAMADRIAVISKGKLMQVGTPQEVYFDPVNEFVASTVGEPPMNFIHAEIVEEDGKLCATHSGQRFPLERPTGVRGKVDIGIRPVDIAITQETGGEYCWPVKVRSVLPTGAKQIVEVMLGRQIVLVKSVRDKGFLPDSDAFIRLDQKSVYLFDAQSKERIREEGEVRQDG